MLLRHSVLATLAFGTAVAVAAPHGWTLPTLPFKLPTGLPLPTALPSINLLTFKLPFHLPTSGFVPLTSSCPSPGTATIGPALPTTKSTSSPSHTAPGTSIGSTASSKLPSSSGLSSATIPIKPATTSSGAPVKPLSNVPSGSSTASSKPASGSVSDSSKSASGGRSSGSSPSATTKSANVCKSKASATVKSSGTASGSASRFSKPACSSGSGGSGTSVATKSASVCKSKARTTVKPSGTASAGSSGTLNSSGSLPSVSPGASIKTRSASAPGSGTASASGSRSSSNASSRTVNPSGTAFSSSSSSSVPTDIGKPVDTTSGQIIGHLAPNTTRVSEYLGIPFAQPPVGDLRFAPPVAYVGNGSINADAFGADCPCITPSVPQALGPRLYTLLGDTAQVNDTLAEDCLFVNVWTKYGSGSASKPVLVWIYGGGFNFGGTAIKSYNGRHFADDEDVVFVSFNYRTNILGFHGAPGLTQNVGLLDQRLAIEWVRDNIAAFSGDPSRITIFGQSAGGASVDFYTFSYYQDPIIAGAIPMSGSTTSFTTRTADGAAAAWYNVTTQVGCGNDTTSTPDAVLACMRTTNVTKIELAAAADPGLGSLLGRFGPTVDETVIFPDYNARSASGYIANVPTLTGNTNYESGLLILVSAGAGQGYPDSFWEYVNEQIFTCPVSRAARQRVANNIPVWRYYYGGAYPNLVLPTSNLTQAWHTSELPVIFGNAEEVTLTPNIEPETEVGDYLRHVWATFASDPANGLTGLGWPAYSGYQTNSSNYIQIGLNNGTTPIPGLSTTQIETPCSF